MQVLKQLDIPDPGIDLLLAFLFRNQQVLIMADVAYRSQETKLGMLVDLNHVSTSILDLFQHLSEDLRFVQF